MNKALMSWCYRRIPEGKTRASELFGMASRLKGQANSVPVWATAQFMGWL